MSFSALFSWLRRPWRWFIYELFQVALWVAFGLRTLTSLRSAFGGGGVNGVFQSVGRAIRPRRNGPRRRPIFTHPSAA